jgi:hypothetical protein
MASNCRVNLENIQVSLWSDALSWMYCMWRSFPIKIHWSF